MIYWACKYCRGIEKTSVYTFEILHAHGLCNYILSPFRKRLLAVKSLDDGAPIKKTKASKGASYVIQNLEREKSFAKKIERRLKEDHDCKSGCPCGHGNDDE